METTASVFKRSGSLKLDKHTHIYGLKMKCLQNPRTRHRNNHFYRPNHRTNTKEKSCQSDKNLCFRGNSIFYRPFSLKALKNCKQLLCAAKGVTIIPVELFGKYIYGNYKFCSVMSNRRLPDKERAPNANCLSPSYLGYNF